MTLKDARKQIDFIDNEIKRLFKERMEIVQQVAEIKRRNGTMVLDKNRENNIMSRITQDENEDTANQLQELYSTIFNISRAYQTKHLSLEYGLIGNPLSHSYSEMIHNYIGRYKYDIIELAADELDGFMRRNDWKGVNVTIPYKQAVIPYCANLSDTAKRVGSVNTIFRCENNKLYGDNTDYMGFKYMCDFAGISLSNKNVTILGSGGTSLTAQAFAHDNGADSITVVSRSGEYNYSNLYLLKNTDVIINTTPIGMYPNCGVSAVDIADFPQCSAVIDVIYNPLKTKLLLDAERRGIKCANGLTMLVAQAIYSAELFTGESFDITIIKTVHDKLKQDIGNIILIGMPGCGKTTIGKAVAETLGREFVDTDKWIERHRKQSASEIITLYGEQTFRELEHAAVKELSKQNRLVISTGGGTILREDNCDMLRQNGFIIWLQRPVNLLEITERPLSFELDETYRKREPLYRKCSDIIVDNSHLIDDTVKRIIDILL